MTGTIVSIHIAAKRGEPMTSPSEVELVAGVGILGDRKAIKPDDPPKKRQPDRQLTLIEKEKIDAFNLEHNLAFTGDDLRRNLVTQGIDLNALVGKEFVVGGATVRGIELCQPCSYLSKRTDPRLIKGLFNRGGLRAEILTSGTVKVGDVVDAEES